MTTWQATVVELMLRADVVELAWRGGARFDAWTERFSLKPWRAAFDAAGVDPAQFDEIRFE